MNSLPRTHLNLRAIAHRGLDTIRGGQQTRLTGRITSAMQADTAPNCADGSLQALLRHAIATTSAYGRMSRNSSITDFPVVDKHYIRRNTNALMSRIYDSSTLATASTSGSTGAPLTVYQDQNKRLWRSAEAIYFGQVAGYHVGMPVYYLKVWSERNHKSTLGHFLRNTHPIDIMSFTDSDAEDLLARISRTTRPVAIIGYSSALSTLAQYIPRAAAQLPSNVATIIGQSEALSTEAATILTSKLDSPVVSRYGNEEIGIIAQQSATHSDYMVNRAGVYVEVLDLDSDQPVPDGQDGRIVVTDLHNYAMPLIRYDTGDLGAFATTPSGMQDITRLASIAGRVLDRLYDSEDRPVSSYIFYKFFWKYREIKQSQLIQEAQGTYTLRLNVDPSFDAESEIIADLKMHLGKAARIRVEYVYGEIPKLRSGKYRQVVQNYTPASRA